MFVGVCIGVMVHECENKAEDCILGCRAMPSRTMPSRAMPSNMSLLQGDAQQDVEMADCGSGCVCVGVCGCVWVLQCAVVGCCCLQLLV